MGKKKKGGTFVGNALRFLKKSGKTIAPAILDLAGKITGVSALGNLADMIQGDKELSQVDKDILLAEIDRDIVADKQITERWRIDMSSDSWLSKNARPIALYNILVMFDVILI